MELSKNIEKRTGLIAVLVLFIMFVQLVYLIDYQSLVNDEFQNMGVGKYYISNGDFSPFAMMDHPPLGYLISSMFLYFDNNPIWTRTPHDSFYILANSGYDINYLLFITRLPIALTAILLGVYVFNWAKELYGKKAALLTLLLFSLEPNILTHFSIATTDFVMTAFIFITMYYLWKFEKQQTFMTAMIGGIALGLALISKHTALILIPIALTFFVLRHKREIFTKNFRKIGVYFLIAFVVVWAFYGFEVSTISKSVHSETKALEFANKTISNEFSRNIVTSSFDIPIPASHYAAALGVRVYHSSTGQNYYFLGELSNKSRWYYYQIVFLLKTPIPLLVLLTIIIGAIAIGRRKLDWKNEKFLIVFILVYFIIMSVVVGLNSGLRHILPIYPFLFVLAGSVIYLKFQNSRNTFRIILIALIVWYVAEAIMIFPHNLSYFNEFIGGPQNGWLYFTDADVDQSQELKGFSIYVEKNKIDHVFVTNATFRLPTDLYLKNYSFAGCTPKNGIYGIYSSYLTLSKTEGWGCYSWLRNRTPNTTIGYALMVYNVTDAQE